MEEPAFLVAVQRIVSGIEVEDDLFGLFWSASRKSSTNRLSIAPGRG